PGIDFTNDPLLQGRLFSYTDTQLIRLGGPNFHEIPINRPVVPVHNNQRDGFMRQTINAGKASYNPNSLGGNDPAQVKAADGGFVSHNQRIDAKKIRARSKSFFDHYSQAKLFYNSQSVPEQNHIINALSFELGKVKTVAIRERMLAVLSNINMDLTNKVANNLGMPSPKKTMEVDNASVPADGNPKDFASIEVKPELKTSAALSMADTVKDNISTRKIAFLLADGVDGKSVTSMKDVLEAEGAVVEMIGTHGGTVRTIENATLSVNESLLTSCSVLYDAVFVPSGKKSISALSSEADALHFLNEAYKHCKAICFDSEAEKLMERTYFNTGDKDGKNVVDPGLITGNGKMLAENFIKAIAGHRVWEREKPRMVPA
ncbi:MAG: catalase, partial [Pedobacter sp.]